MPDHRADPFLANRFALEIDGLIQGGFQECSGLMVEVDYEERREGGLNDYAHRFPRGARLGNIVLKRGLTDSDGLWAWHQGVLRGGTRTEKDVSVILFDSGGRERWRWNIRRARPAKWTGPELKADGNAVAIESLELVHHGIEKA